ncbi:hypothetical protein [Sphingobacterium thalpophilum]|nr:hypothetical protein [Sphingobacterium thalpophilum]
MAFDLAFDLGADDGGSVIEINGTKPIRVKLTEEIKHHIPTIT